MGKEIYPSETRLKHRYNKISFPHPVLLSCFFVLKFGRECGSNTIMLCAKLQSDQPTEMDVMDGRNFVEVEFEISFTEIPYCDNLLIPLGPCGSCIVCPLTSVTNLVNLADDNTFLCREISPDLVSHIKLRNLVKGDYEIIGIHRNFKYSIAPVDDLVSFGARASVSTMMNDFWPRMSGTPGQRWGMGCSDVTKRYGINLIQGRHALLLTPHYLKFSMRNGTREITKAF